MRTAITTSLLFIVLACQNIMAEEFACDTLWERDKELNEAKARALFEGREWSPIEGIWKSENMSFLIFEAPSNECNIGYRIIVLKISNRIRNVFPFSHSGNIIGLILNGSDGNVLNCFYKACNICKPCNAAVSILDNGNMVISSSDIRKGKISAKKIYPTDKRLDDYLSPLNGPVRRNGCLD